MQVNAISPAAPLPTRTHHERIEAALAAMARSFAPAPGPRVQPTPFEVVRDMPLPDTGRILDQVAAIEAFFHKATGGWLDCRAAVRLLDAIRDERGIADIGDVPTRVRETPGLYRGQDD